MEDEEAASSNMQQSGNAGDERFEVDIYKRIMDRKFRIGKYLL